MGKAKEIAELGDKITVSGGTVTVADISTSTFSGTSIHSMQDVDLTGIAHNMFLKYNLSNTQFEVVAGNTSSIDEGTNLYYTDARVASYLSSNDFDTATNIVASITDSAPGTLDTLNELASALDDDPNFATTTANNIATKLPLAGGTMTGTLTVTGANTHLDGRNSAGLTLDLSGTGHYIIKESTTNDIIKFGGTGTSNFIAHNISSGNVGIGTDDPDTPLVVKSDSGGNTFKLIGRSADNISSLTFANAGNIASNYIQGNSSFIRARADSGFHFRKGGTPVTTDSSGFTIQGLNVGIGVAGPSARLQVAGTQNTPSGTSKGMLLVRADGSTHGLQMGVNSSAPWGSWIQAQDNNISSPYPLTLQPGGGDVGIGTTSPTAKLHIQRAVYGGYNSLLLENTNANAGVLNFVDLQMLAGGSTGKVILRMENSSASGATDGELAIHTTSGGTTTERMRIDNNGNVGIGTNNPSTLLDVRGEVSIAYNASYGLRLYNQSRNNWSSIGNRQTNNSADLVFKSGTGSITFTHSGDLQLGDIQETTGGGNISLTKTSSSSIISIMSRSATDGHTGMLNFYKTPATSGNYTSTTSGDVLGEIRFYGVNNSAVADIGAMIQVSQTGAFNNSVPAKMTFTTQETQRMSIHADGHIGIGDNVTVSSAWSTVFGARVQMDTRGVLAATDSSMQIGHNWYYDGGGSSGYKYIASGKANRQIHVDDYISWEMEETAGTAGAEITFTERMRLTKDGNLGINVGSNNPSDRLVVVAGGTGILVARNWSGNVTSGSGLGEIGFKGYADGNSTLASDAKITGVADGNHSGTSAPARLEFYVKHPTTGPGSAPNRRMQLSSYGELLLEDGATGWASFYMNEQSGIRYHVKRFYTGVSGVTQNIMRVKRHYWGSGFYKISVKQQYYSTVSEQNFYLNGHGRNDGSYSPSYSLTYKDIHNGTSGRVSITSPVASSPGNSAANYVDLQISIPSYTHWVVVVEAGGMAGFSHDVSSMSGNDMYALH